MKAIKLSKILNNGKALFLAYDQGMEHGPSSDFNDKNVDPLYILDIAKKGKYTAIVFHKGIAEKYIKEIKKSRVPLIIKLNGKTNLYSGEPVSRPLGNVSDCIKLGAVGVGYTVYIGSKYESIMFKDFSKIETEAHQLGLPVILWVYVRSKKIKDDSNREMMAYAARTGLELGADIVKIKYNGDIDDLKWAVKSAGRTKIVVAGGKKKDEESFLKSVKGIIEARAIGLAVGRNVWQSKDPLKLSKELREIVFD